MLRLRTALICFVGSLVLVLLSAPLMRTLVLQINMMRPTIDESEAASYETELRRSATLIPLWRAFTRLSQPVSRPDDADEIAKLDPANGLRAWLELLMRLRQVDRSTTSGPADADAGILNALVSIRSAPPVRLYATHERDLVLKALADVPPKQRAAHAAYLLYHWPENAQPNASRSGRPLLGELAARLEALAARWQEEGKLELARTAREAIVRLMTDMVRDSPTPELALLASEHLTPALRNLGETDKAERLDQFRAQYRRTFQGDRTNLIPYTGQTVLAANAHDHVLRSMTATLAVLAAWVVFAVLSLFLMIVVLSAQPPDEITVQWRHPGQGAREAAVLACSPLLAALIVIAVADIPWAWLISRPSLVPAVLLLGLLLVSSGAATWIGVRLPETFRPCPLPRKAAWSAGALVVPTLLLLVLFVPVGHESWRPPVAIQRFRLWGTVIGGMSLGLAVLWLIAGVVHRTRTGLPPGVWARAGLGVATSALMFTSILLWPVLVANQYFDIRHERAFVRAAADPVADRLGSDWLKHYFLAPASGGATASAASP